MTHETFKYNISHKYVILYPPFTTFLQYIYIVWYNIVQLFTLHNKLQNNTQLLNNTFTLHYKKCNSTLYSFILHNTVYMTSQITVRIEIAREYLFKHYNTTISQRNTKKHVGFKSRKNKLNGGLARARATRVHSLRRRRSLTCPILLSNQDKPSISNGTRGTRALLITMVRVSVNETRIVYLWSRVYPFLSGWLSRVVFVFLRGRRRSK